MSEGIMLRPRLLVCVIFPGWMDALHHLFEVLLALSEIRFAPLDVRIFTDCMVQDDRDRIEKLARLLSAEAVQFSVNFQKIDNSGDLPLSWAHIPLLRSEFTRDVQSYTHFIYLGDLIRFSSRNLSYFLKFRSILRPFGLIPGFLQVEFSRQAGTIILPDFPAPMKRSGRSTVDLGDIDFVCVDAPFVPMHVMDAELVDEYLASPASDFQASRAVIGWGDAQRAAMGLTFADPPHAHRWRTAVPMLRAQGIPYHSSWVHHVSNAIAARHAAEPEFPLGRICLDGMLVED